MNKVTNIQVLRGFPKGKRVMSKSDKGMEYSVDTDLFHMMADEMEAKDAEMIQLKARLYDFEHPVLDRHARKE